MYTYNDYIAPQILLRAHEVWLNFKKRIRMYEYIIFFPICLLT